MKFWQQYARMGGSIALFALVLALAGLAGAVAHVSLLWTPIPPAGGGGSALNALLATLTCLFGLEALWWAHPASAPIARGAYASRCRFGASLLVVAAAVLEAIFLVIGYRVDSAAWALALALAAALLLRERVHATTKPGGPRLLAFDSSAAPDEPEGASGSDRAANDGCGGSVPPSSARASCAACCCAPKGTSALRRAAFAAHALVWGIATVCAVLVLGGSGTIAVGWRRFPRRGELFTVSPTEKLHAYCVGPRNSSLPTIWLEVGGGGHSSSDALGMEVAFAGAGRRVCNRDPPGTAWSPLLSRADTVDADSPSQMRALMAALNEPGPFVLVGTMDGGAERIYDFALMYPALTAALVPMQYGPPEFDAYAAFHGMAADDARVVAYAQAQIASRLAFCDVIRLLGTSWGLVSFFAPHNPRFVPASEQDACRFLNLFHEGQWDMQCRMLAAQVRAPETIVTRGRWQADRSLSPTIPVLAIGNFYTDPCAANRVAGDDCALLELAQAMSAAFMRNMTTMSAGSAFINACANDADAVCEDWLGSGATVPFVTQAVLARF